MPAFPDLGGSEREGLERQGIFYVDCLGQESDSHDVSTRIHQYLGISKPRSQTGKAPIPVPDHVNLLREALLDHRRLISRHALDSLHKDERHFIPSDAIFKDVHQERRHLDENLTAIIRESRSVAHKASKLQRDGTSKHEWRKLLDEGIFGRCADKEALLFNDHSKRDKLLDSYELARNMEWNNASLQRSSTHTRFIQRTSPGITLGFPVLQQQARCGLERTSLIDNFSYANLQSLSLNGLIYRPTAEPDNPSRKTFDTLDRNGCDMCFPFSTTDYGPVESQTSLSCKAANAASKALSIVESLYRYAGMHDSRFHIPPVVNFTCSGPTVRVWTAYSLPSSNGRPVHIMTCIKQSDMTSTWAVMEMHSIIRNLLRWAIRILKPDLSLQLDYWHIALRRYPTRLSAQPEEAPISPIEVLSSAAIKNHNRINGVRDIQLMAMVRKLEDDKAALERSNRELHERNAELTSFLKQATGDIRDALYEAQRPDSGVGTYDEHYV